MVPTTVTLLGGDLIVKKRVTRTTRCLFPEGSLALLSGSDVNGVKSSCRNVPGAMKNREDAHLRTLLDNHLDPLRGTMAPFYVEDLFGL